MSQSSDRPCDEQVSPRAVRLSLPLAGGPAVRFDHAVIAVRSLEPAVAELRRHGFEVVAGGRHRAHGTHNALILLEGGYLELIALEDPSRPPQSALAADVAEIAARGGGLAGYALAVDRSRLARQTVATASANGAAPASLRMSRRSNGERLSWTLWFAEREGFIGPFPFFIRWHARAPYERFRSAMHKNGVRSVAALEILVGPESVHAVDWYERSLASALDVEVAIEPTCREPHHGGQLAAVTLATGAGRMAAATGPDDAELALDPEALGATTLRVAPASAIPDTPGEQR